MVLVERKPRIRCGLTSLHNVSVHMSPRSGSRAGTSAFGGGETRYFPVSDQSSPKTTTLWAVPSHASCMLCPRWSCWSHTRYRKMSMEAAAPVCKSLGKNLMLVPGWRRKRTIRERRWRRMAATRQ